MLKASELTSGERLLIVRRREGCSKAEAASGCGVSLYRYTRFEADKERGPTARTGRLSFAESALLERLRAGISAAAQARAVGCSRWWLTQMETGQVPDTRLREHLGA